MQKILHYLVQHPEARDTLDGVIGWWLPPDTAPPQAVEEALQWLAGRGWVDRVLIPGQPPLYSLNKRNAALVEEYLRSGSDQRPGPPGGGNN